MGSWSEDYDPSGAPEPVSKGSAWLDNVVALAMAGALAYGGYIVVAPMLVGHTAGATRSARLRWEERQRVIAHQIDEGQAAQDGSYQSR